MEHGTGAAVRWEEERRRLTLQGEEVLDGFITFVNVGKDGRPAPHGLTLEASTPEEQALQERARSLPRD